MGEETTKNNTASESSESDTKTGTFDSWYQKVAEYFAEKIATFVAFLFFLFAAGAIFGAYVMIKAPQFATYIIIAPIVLGLMAYYSRSFATILFIVLILLFLI